MGIGIVRNIFKLCLWPKKAKKKDTPILDKPESEEDIAIQGETLHKALEFKDDLILKYLGVGIDVNQHISLFSSGADSLSLPFINTVAGNIQ